MQSRTSGLLHKRTQLAIVVAVLSFLVMDRPVLAQLNGPSFPQMEQPAPTPTPAPVAVPAQVCYWIASSRRCCQKFQTRCPKGSLDYFAADANSCLTNLEEPAFLASLRYDVPICFVVHGDLTSFQDVRNAAPKIVDWIKAAAPGQPVQIVFYTWPSDDETNPLPQLDISARGERAEFNGCYLAQLIDRFPAQTRVSFFGHSFGTRIISATLHLLAGGSLPGCGFRCPAQAQRTYRAVFTAAAIDRTWLNPRERYGRALGITEWLLNMKNGADFVINLYPLRTIFGPQALGRFGFSPRDRMRMGPLSARVTEWDVTMGIGSRHAWSYYYRRPEIAAVMAPILTYTGGPPAFLTRGPAPVRPRPATNPPQIAAPRSGQKSPPAILRDSTRTEPTAGRSGL